MNVAIYNQKGGVGKSTLTAHLGFLAMELGMPVTIIDGDLQQDTMRWLSGHTWNGDENLQLGSVLVTLNMEYDSQNIIVDCPPALEVTYKLKNVKNWIVPVDGRFSVESAMDVVHKIKEYCGDGSNAYIVVNKAILSGFGRKERKEIENSGLKVFCFDIPQADVVRKAETYGMPAWKVAYGNRSLATQNLRLFCKWVFEGFSERQLI